MATLLLLVFDLAAKKIEIKIFYFDLPNISFPRYTLHVVIMGLNVMWMESGQNRLDFTHCHVEATMTL